MAVLALDDRDASITYSTGWALSGSVLEYNRTTTWTGVAGSTARIAFRGTSIGVFGTVSGRKRGGIAPETTYSMDGGVPVKFTATQTLVNQYNQLFYQSPVIENGLHNLLITNVLAAEPFFMDFMLVVVPADATSLTTSTSSTSTTSTTSSTSTQPPSLVVVTITSTSSSPTTSPTEAPSNGGNALGSTSSSKSNNTPAIVGGIIAGIVVLVLLIFGIIFWRRRQNQRKSEIRRSRTSWPPAMQSNAKLADPPRHSQPPMTQAEQPPFSSYHNNGGYGQEQYTNSVPSYSSPPPQGAGYGQYPDAYGHDRNYQQYPDGGPSYTARTSPQDVDSADAYGGISTYGDERSAYATPTQGYIPPSQLIAAGNDYGRMPPPHNPTYAAQNQSGGRVRVRLDG
ncbi:hypothetical protein B0H34DRAFT_802952 [Crassisporium funariophilum]|nr:hypothetical protein B0H34DRAFT_802952 [Crassisporium funariophilum]